MGVNLFSVHDAVLQVQGQLGFKACVVQRNDTLIGYLY